MDWAGTELGAVDDLGACFLGDKIRQDGHEFAAPLTGHGASPRAKQKSWQPYTAAMSTCMVTGGAGFLGSHLCDELLARGNRVICVDNLETGSLANIEHIRDPEHFCNVNVDIIEPY